MKHLYESLQNTIKLSGEIKNWILSHKDVKRYRHKIYDAEVSADNDGFFKINLLSNDHIFLRINIFGKDFVGNKFPYKISEITLNGEPLDINYHNVIFGNKTNFPKIVDTSMRLYGCTINKLDSLPEKCYDLYFCAENRHVVRPEKYITISSEPTKVNKIENIKVSTFCVQDPGMLQCDLKNIKNITVDGETMLSDKNVNFGKHIYTEKPESFDLPKDAQEQILLFVKNNKINLKRFELNFNYADGTNDYINVKIHNNEVSLDYMNL